MTNVKKKSKVVMLPTNEKATRKSDLAINENNLLFQPSKLEGTWFFLNKFQHLYILSDDEIKEDDWFYNPATKETLYASKDMLSWNNDTTQEHKGWKKIVATTDKSLKMECQGCRFHRNNSSVIYTCSCQYLPQPSKQFIEKYIEEYNSGNIITEVMVEYESYCVYGDNCPSKGAYDKQHLCKIDYKLKINSKDNTITISKCKDSWSREEVEEIIWNYKNYLNTQNETVFGDTDNWIEENL